LAHPVASSNLVLDAAVGCPGWPGRIGGRLAK
jgi:hypothetical protein